MQLYKDMLGGTRSLPRSKLYTKISKISWRISKPLDLEKNQLFHHIENTNYTIYGYLCSCGKEDIVLSLYDVPDYTCCACGNNVFHDANFAHTDLNKFLEKYCPTMYRKKGDPWVESDETHYNLERISIPIDFIYVVEELDNRIISGCKTDISIPKDIDFSRNKIYSNPVFLFDVTFYNDGTVEENYKIPYEYKLFLAAYKNLNDYINERDGVFGISRQKSERLSHKSIAFFLHCPWLKEYDFFLWDTVGFFHKKELSVKEALMVLLKDRKQKSLKKALFENYTTQMSKYGEFQTVIVDILLETIDDVNLAVRLLKQDLLGDTLTLTDKLLLRMFLRFLKKHYSEIQIVRLIEEIKGKERFLLDTLREYSFLRDNIDDIFNKPKCTLMDLHDHLFVCARRQRNSNLSEEKLCYEEKFEKAQSSVMDYVVKLPYTNKELYDWSIELHNCLSGYYNTINSGKEIVYGFFKNEVIEFAVSIVDGAIEEARGKYNKELNSSQKEATRMWFKLRIEKKYNFFDK